MTRERAEGLYRLYVIQKKVAFPAETPVADLTCAEK